MMLKRTRATTRTKTVAPVKIILSAEDRRKLAEFIILLDIAERRSNVVENARKKKEESKV